MKSTGSITVILKRAGLAALLWLPLCAPAGAESGRPGGIFDFGAGARPLAMGGAYTAAARDATALYYNPAGLSMMSNRNLALMHAALFESATYDYAAYGQNYSRISGAWAVQLMRLDAGSAEGRDENNVVTRSFSYSETAFGLGTGIRGLFLPFLSLGGSVKVLSRSLAESSDTQLGFDVGGQYGPLYDGKLSLAFSIQNFGGFSSGDTEDKLPMTFKLGAAYAVIPAVTLCADIQDFAELRLGGEYLVGPGAIRLGYDRGAFSYGAGLKFLKSFQADFAMTKHETLGLSSRLSFAYFFGARAAAPPKVSAHAPEYLSKAQTNLKAREYVPAYDNVNMAIGLDPGIKKGAWGEKHLRLGGLVAGLKLKELPERQELLKATDEQAVEAGHAVDEYLAGNNSKGMMLAHSALGYKPGSAFFSDFLKEMSSVTGQAVKSDEIMPKVAMAKEKLRKAETYFQLTEYDKAAKECEQVIQLEPDNALAWTRLGSAYFAIGDMARARQAFETSLKLDPSNASVQEFMRLQGW